MTTWLIEPRDPLIVQDGRPFGPNPGARARSLPFPFPSTITGAVRTRDGQYHNNGVFPAGDQNTIQRVLGIGVRGPLLVALDPQGDIKDWLLPAPGDALLLPDKDDNNQVKLRRLTPIQLKKEEQTELPDDLVPVGVTPYDPGKPTKNPPQFWSWRNAYEQWILKPTEEKLEQNLLGHSGPMREERMHVNIEPETQTAREGFLFLTSGLEFSRPEKPDVLQLPPVHRLALALETDARMHTGMAPLGGERRLMRWRKSNVVWPILPQGLADMIADAGHCRLMLLTPAYFTHGWRPDWILRPQHGVQPKLIAAIVRNPQVVSGWDFAANTPKPSRRLAPAGAVYFLKLSGSPDDIRAWVKHVWMACISDDPRQNRLDGFGLAVLGTWSGQLQPLEV